MAIRELKDILKRKKPKKKKVRELNKESRNGKVPGELGIGGKPKYEYRKPAPKLKGKKKIIKKINFKTPIKITVKKKKPKKK